MALRDKVLEKNKSELPPPIIIADMEFVTEMDELIPPHLALFLEQQAQEQQSSGAGESPPKIKSVAEGLEGRDESAALEETALDLIRLDRAPLWANCRNGWRRSIDPQQGVGE